MNTFYPLMPTMLLSEDAVLPKYAHDVGDVGLDLCITEDLMLRPFEWRKVSSDVAVAIPNNFAGLVFPRSGWGCRGLVLKNTVGVIDSNYRGAIQLTLYNNNDSEWIHVSKGDRVAQLVVVPVAHVQVLKVDSLDETERGSQGFGSSGYGRL